MSYLRKNIPYFQMDLSAAQSNITNVTWTNVQLDRSVYDSHSGVDTANYKYVIPWGWGGIWYFNSCVYFSSIAANALVVTAIYDGASNPYNAWKYKYARSTSEFFQQAQHIEVAEGDSIYLYAFHGKGDNTPDINSYWTWLEGCYVTK